MAKTKIKGVLGMASSKEMANWWRHIDAILDASCDRGAKRNPQKDHHGQPVPKPNTQTPEQKK